MNAAPQNLVFTQPVTLADMATFLFLMLGPIKILGPFVRLTQNGDAVFAKRLAFRGFLFSCLSLAFTALIGESAMRRYGISVPVLAIAAGIILFLVALQTVLEQFGHGPSAPHPDYEPSLKSAASPLAFPTIVTPYGIGAVIIFMALTPDLFTRAEIALVLLALMLLDLLAMLYAKPVITYLGMPLQLLGTVLGVIQVALGLQIIVAGLHGLGLGQ